MAARPELGCYEKRILTHFHACKGLSNDYVGAAWGTVFQEIRPDAGFKTGDFAEEKLGRLLWNDSLVSQNCRKAPFLFLQLVREHVFHVPWPSGRTCGSLGFCSASVVWVRVWRIWRTLPSQQPCTGKTTMAGAAVPCNMCPTRGYNTTNEG